MRNQPISSKMRKRLLKAFSILLAAVFVINFSLSGAIKQASAAAHSTLTALETVANVTASTDNQTFTKVNAVPNSIEGLDDSQDIAAIPAQMNVEAGLDDTQDITVETPQPSADIGEDDTQDITVDTPQANIEEGADDTQDFSTLTTQPNGEPGADNTQGLIATTTTPFQANAEADFEDVTGIAGYEVLAGAPGNVLIRHTATATDGFPNIEGDDNGDDTYDDAVVGLLIEQTIEGVAAEQSVTDITIDTPFADGDTLVIDNCTISFIDDVTGGDQSDVDCSGDTASIDTDALATAIAQADVLAGITGLDNYAVSNDVSGDAIFRLTHTTTAVDGNPAEGSGITDTDDNVTVTPITVGEVAVQSINTITFTGDITAGAHVRFNDTLVITFGNATADTDASDNEILLSRLLLPVAQVADFTPAGAIEAGDVFTIVINGSDYSFTALDDTIQGLVEGLAPTVDADDDVSCSEDDTKVICTAEVASVPFAYNAVATNLAPIAQVTDFIPSGSVEVGDIFTITINGTDYSYAAENASIKDVVEGLLPLVNVASTTVECTEDDSLVECTAVEAGTEFTAAASAENMPAVAQTSTFTPIGVIEIGDVFTITINGVPYEFAADGTTAQSVVEGLRPLVDDDLAVSCTENDISLICSADTAGIAFVPGAIAQNRLPVAQISTFTPSGTIEAGDVFTITINGIDYEFVSVDTTVQGIVEGLQPLVDGNDDVNCSEDDTAVTCTGDVVSIPFTAAATAVNKPAVAEVVDFTPSGAVEVGDIFTITINGTDYDFAATDESVQNVVEGLQQLADADDAVTCTEDNIKVTCSADDAGLEFTYEAAAANSQNVAQVDDLTPANIGISDIFTVTGVTIDAVSVTATTTSAADLVNALVIAINDAIGATVTASNNAGKLRLTSIVPADPFAAVLTTTNYPGVAQIVTFTPANVTSGETFYITLNGTAYGYKATAATVQNVVGGLQPLVNANAAVTCTEDDTKVTCVAATSGTAFTYSTSVSAASGGGMIFSGGGTSATVAETTTESAETPAAEVKATTETAVETSDSGEPARDRNGDVTWGQIAADGALIASGDINRLLADMGLKRNLNDELKYSQTIIKDIIGSESNAQIRNAITNFVTYGTRSSKSLGAGERAGVINSFKAAFGRLPQSAADWSDIIAVGNGRWPNQTAASAETNAMASFKNIYKREANMDNARDNAAVTVMSYGLRPAYRNMDSEKAGINIFKAIFKHAPLSANDWDMVRAIAYSGATR